ncbi:YqcC family protein [Oceanimonas baumannii]|uniref:YqcC family protein n=1 Tax=Oceanimonas baumannii TaxID=129578 RepID=UPI001D1852BF|nr:YqcC family protein [Oceanimonas baumannii]MCC4263120.1 YqcC family protein [Oceanimonas baumannii]
MSATVHHLLLTIEHELNTLGWWQNEPPPPGALQSTQPFCLDTLSLPQWLQFVLLPRLRDLLAAGQPLPARIAVYPMATESMKGAPEETSALLEAIAQLDETLTGRPVEREA